MTLKEKRRLRVLKSRVLMKTFGRMRDEVTGVKVKGKAIPLQTRTGPEGSSRIKLPDFKATGT
jgi:hypothetical protein